MEKTNTIRYTDKLDPAYGNEEISRLLEAADLDEAELLLFLLQMTTTISPLDCYIFRWVVSPQPT